METTRQAAEREPTFGDGVVVTFLAGLTALAVVLALHYGIGWHWLVVAVVVFFIYADVKTNNIPTVWYLALVVFWIVALNSISPLLIRWFESE